MAAGLLRHGGHPVLRWVASNVIVKTEAAGNFLPDKQNSTEKIDGIVALSPTPESVRRSASWGNIGAVLGAAGKRPPASNARRTPIFRSTDGKQRPQGAAVVCGDRGGFRRGWRRWPGRPRGSPGLCFEPGNRVYW